MSSLDFFIAIVGGTLAGFINTLAGNGSAITLLILTEVLQLPPNVANGSNRLGVFSGSAMGAYVFYKNDKIDLSRSWVYFAFTCIGAIGGVLLAIWVSNEQFHNVFRIMMVVMLVVILVNPKRWLIKTDLSRKPNLWLAIPLFLAIGFYGGFIQMGMGIFFLAAMVLGARFSLIDANAVKTSVVAVYTVVVILIFYWKGLIHWQFGLILAAGQMIGAVVAANFASKYPHADVWTYRLLVLIIVLAIFKMFEVQQYFI